MRPSGEALISSDVLDLILSLKPAERAKLRSRFLQLADFPERRTDYSETDNVGRLIDIHIVGRFAVRYWTDHADKHVKILEVVPADHRRSTT